MKKRKRLCGRHQWGVLPGTLPFFVAGCPQCEAKKAAGLVTGNEGNPTTQGASGRANLRSQRRSSPVVRSAGQPG